MLQIGGVTNNTLLYIISITTETKAGNRPIVGIDYSGNPPIGAAIKDGLMPAAVM